MINYSIGSRIKELRQKNKLSQLQLAINSDITPAYLSMLERDEKNPTVNCLSKICTSLNLSLKDFFDDRFSLTNSALENQLIAEIHQFSNEEQIELLQIIRNIQVIKNCKIK